MNQTPISNAVAHVMAAARATGLFVSLATITAPSGDFTAGGSPDGVYLPVSGLVDIPCMDAPQAVDRYNIMSAEQRAESQTTSSELRHVLLDDYFSQLSPETNWGDIGWRCSIDGVDYDISSAESDSQRTQTRLSLRGVTV